MHSLSDRMKHYEAMAPARQLEPGLPTIVRLDGRAFHSFTRGAPPFYASMQRLMDTLAEGLMAESCADLAYTQSDEISLVWHPDTAPYFDGRVVKIITVLASTAGALLNSIGPDMASQLGWQRMIPVFDARLFQVPTLSEAANAVLWRMQDATRNAIQMLGQQHYSHNALHGMSCQAIVDALPDEYSALTDRSKHGRLFWRRRESVPFTAEEIERLPERHAARTNPDLLVERWVTHSCASELAHADLMERLHHD